MAELHVKQIKRHISESFVSFLDLSDVNQNDVKTPLSRGLAAYALSLVANNLTPQQCAAHITDGTGDNGIDGLYYDSQSQTLILIQSKWHENGHGSIERGDGQKFLQGLDDLVTIKFDRFNNKIKNLKNDIEKCLLRADTKIRLILVSTGIEDLSDEVKRDLHGRIKELNDTDETFFIDYFNQKYLHQSLKYGGKEPEISFDIKLYEYGHIREPYDAYYGCIAASDIAWWYEKYSQYILEPNIRNFLGDTEINLSIQSTLETNPDCFWYFNNGITALCSSIKRKPIGGKTRESAIFECKNLQIVNGAQTVGTIAKTKIMLNKNLDNVRVPIKIISLEDCPEGFSQEVTRAANTQNKIEKKDFISHDPVQIRLQEELRLERIEYIIKSGITQQDKTKSFDLEDAVTALACASNLKYAVLAKRELGSFWENINKPPYKALFNESLSGPMLWATVKLNREIEKELESLGNRLPGRSLYYCVHGNRLIAHEVLKRLDLKKIDDLDSFNECSKKIGPLVVKIHSILESAAEELFPNSYLAILFKNTPKCQELSDIIEKIISQKGNPISKSQQDLFAFNKGTGTE